jgi:lysophospholipase L1-like esterase
MAPAAPVGPKYAQVTNFGASITCGYYATQDGATGYIWSNHGYAGLFDSSLTGTTAQNLCRGGDQAADMVRAWVMPNAAPTLAQKQLYTVMVGTNDIQLCGGQTGCLENYMNAMTASLAWLALPASDKVLGSSLLPSSAWASDLNVGVATNTAGASLSFPVTQAVDGRTLYIAYRVFDAGKVNGGTATVKVDGNAVATLSTIANAGRSIATINGSTDTIWAVGIPLGAAGSHTVTITNGANGGFFSFQWAGVSTGQYATTSGAPRVMVALLPQSTGAYYNIVLVSHNNALNKLATALANDGTWVTVVHCESVLNLTTDFVDTIHPNDAGHAKLAAAFESVL